ncbi:helix-turn-helix domain-containing protein [Streptomyces sp. CA-106131]|uniref:helix-turn-helix domain-containing protein n=1 Tax=Streptomyces sp. CA-106131 TaxID=3240045 RepID=UPI003D8AC8CA
MANEADSDDRTLADLRALTGLSQREVARRMGVTEARPGQIERDFPNVRFSVVQAYIQALGGRIEFAAVGSGDVWADEITRDPTGPRDHGDRAQLHAIDGGAEPADEDDVLCGDDDEQREAAAWRGRRQRRRQTHPWPAM